MKNLHASIKDRLLNLARASNHPFNFVFTRYLQERLLYRLSTGVYADRIVLKGGLWLTAMTHRFLRATKDVDLEAEADADADAMRAFFVEAISHEVPDDGVVFDVAGITAEIIKAADEYHGIRLFVQAAFGRQQERVQIDFGFGDRILLPPDLFDYPVLLETLPGPRLRIYSKESVIAEKFEAIASLGELNSRYKDFDDIVQLADRHSFYASALWLAMNLTFRTRSTPMEHLTPAIAPTFATPDREQLWKAYCRRQRATTALPTFALCLHALRRFADGPFRFDRDGHDRIWSHDRWDLAK